MDHVPVLCLIGRMIGDSVYVAGEHYTLPSGQATKYAATGYFRILPEPAPPAEAKMAPAPDTKVMRGRITKGLPARAGGAITLDGSPVAEGETMERP